MAFPKHDISNSKKGKVLIKKLQKLCVLTLKFAFKIQFKDQFNEVRLFSLNPCPVSRFMFSKGYKDIKFYKDQQPFEKFSLCFQKNVKNLRGTLRKTFQTQLN